MPPRARLFAALAIPTLLVDQASKAWARAALTVGHPRAVIDGFFDLRLAFNPGIAFSFLLGARVLVTVLGLVACAAIVAMVARAHDARRGYVAGLALVFGGALGNVIDRLISGEVTDFIVWKVGSHVWPTFNVADAALLVGVGFLFLFGGTRRARRVATA